MAFNFKNKIHKVRFYGALEQEREQKNKQDNIVSRRLIVLLCFIVAITSVMAARLALIQFKDSDELAVKLEKYGTATYSTDAPRGEIVDRNYVKLVQNTNVICATYYAPKKIKDEQLKTSAKFLAKTINLDTSSISTRNKKDYFIIAYPDLADELVSDEEKAKLKEQNNYDSALLNLQIERITDEMLEEYMDENTLKYTHFYYLMKSCSSGSSVLAEGISEEEASIIGENIDILPGIDVTTDWSRQYVYDREFSQVLGRVTTKKQGLPSEMKNELLALGYQNDSRVGVSGLEAQYENILRGSDSSYTLNYDSSGNPIVTSTKSGTAGSNIRLSIDWELQQFADSIIEEELVKMNSQNKFFNKMFFTLMDPYTGEIIVMSGKIINKETGEVTDYAAGNYLDANLIGSTIKGGTLYTAFKEGVITPGTTFMDEPIKIKGTKEKKSHRDLGLINEIDALAYSSNVYMFRIAMLLGGANYVYDGPLKINDEAFETLRRDLGELGLGVKTGIDIPNEAFGYRGSKRTGGYLLDASIGQYDTYTNIQLAQYACTLANGGKRIKPHLFLDSYVTDADGLANANYTVKTEVLDDVSSQTTAFSQIKQGMRACVTRTNGTCNSYWSSKSYVTYAKTGTAEDYTGTGETDYPNHLQIGYIQADENSEPIVAFACIAIRQTTASNGGSSSAPLISQQIIDKYVEKYGLN
ncbi:peptidoglycan D,D-transpeptidase FtsI family protein [Thomasclavelia saccharogumia]|uniref:peptidoglycan D,D-transpeptidase FtsI family protein n=1 Tax=Thomasclavelia saccharogumia TaxID=341225 RepID=UPI00047AF034|nr:penicillin-binding protein 2 [Thomasclavelia saccharogumia]